MSDPMTDADQTTRDALAEMLLEHGPSGTVNTVERWVGCVCGEKLPCALDRDTWDDEDRVRAAHLADALLASDAWRTHVTEPLARGAHAERWRESAMPLLARLVELGRALDIPFGENPTGPMALEAVKKLKAERDAALAQVAAVEALLPTWTEATCQTDGAPCSWHRVAAECAGEVTAALADPGPLAEHDRRVKAEAWDEGHRGLCRRHGRVPFEACRNPYRAERVGRGEA